MRRIRRYIRPLSPDCIVKRGCVRPMVLARLSALALVLLAAPPAQGAPPSREAQVAAILAKAAASHPRLLGLLQDFPKGGDLHNHLDGSVYAEDFLTWADADGDCIARE